MKSVADKKKKTSLENMYNNVEWEFKPNEGLESGLLTEYRKH